jgi:mannose-6-phosphate isomerase-like protein (cupin superfamily)
MRRIMIAIGLVASAAFSAYGVALWAQAQEPAGRVRGVKTAPGIYKTKAEVDAAIAKLGAGNDLSTRVFQSKTSTALVNYRVRRGVELAHSMHPDNEINFVVAGSATLTTGGTLPIDENSKEGIKDGVEHSVKAGDWVIVPAGTAHFWSKITGEVTYIQIRLGDEPKK